MSQVGCASSEGLGHNGDSTYFDAASLKQFGLRYAEQIIDCQRQPVDELDEPATK